MKLNCLRAFGLLLILSGVAIALFGTITLLTKPHYHAVATIQIEPPDKTRELGTVEVESEVIQSEETLQFVIEPWNLGSQWIDPRNGGKQLNQDEVLKGLRQRIALRCFPKTRTIEIRVSNSDAMTATMLANALIQAYQKHLEFVCYEIGAREAKLQEERLPNLVKEMNSAKETMERSKVDLKVPDPEPQDVATLYPTFYQARQKYEKQRQLETLASMIINTTYHTTFPKLNIGRPVVSESSIFPDASVSSWICCTGVMMIGYGTYRSRLKC